MEASSTGNAKRPAFSDDEHQECTPATSNEVRDNTLQHQLCAHVLSRRKRCPVVRVCTVVLALAFVVL